MNPVHISIVIPSYNEAEHIRACVESCRRSAGKDNGIEIVVVDNGSADATVLIAREAGAKVIENTRGQRLSISMLRNRGAEETKGNVLAFLDADMEVPPEWIERIRSLWAEGFRGLAAFPCTVPRSAGWVGFEWGETNNPSLTAPRPARFVNGRNMLIDRNLFEAVGGFDEKMITAEDKDFSLRVKALGKAVMLVPGCVLIHYGYEHSLSELARKEFWRQSSTLALAHRHRYSRSVLRNPFLSLWHVFGMIAFVVCLALGYIGWATLALLGWISLDVIMAIRDRGVQSPRRTARLIFLQWLRWQVSGFALIMQIAQLGMKEKR